MYKESSAKSSKKTYTKEKIYAKEYAKLSHFNRVKKSAMIASGNRLRWWIYKWIMGEDKARRTESTIDPKPRPSRAKNKEREDAC
jgi:hypothetical protein